MKPDDNYEVFNENIEIKLGELAHIIGDSLPKGWGFNLLLFDFGKKGSTFYVSNANREDAIKLLKEFIAKQEEKL